MNLSNPPCEITIFNIDKPVNFNFCEISEEYM